MRTTNQRRQAELPVERFTIPWDLSEWVSKSELLEWIESEVEALNWGNPELIVLLAKNPGFRPRVLLRVLTYGYCTTCFDSEELVQHCYEDPVYRRLCEGQSPRASELKQFRKINRGLLKWLLFQVFSRAVRKQLDLGDTWFPAGLKRFVVVSAGERLDLARHMDRVET